MSHAETIKRVNLAECPSCHRMVAQLITVTGEEGFLPVGSKICRQCLDELRFQSFDTKKRRIT